MQLLSDHEAQLVSGGFSIVVSPTIAVSTAIVTGLQGTYGTSLGIGVLGIGSADLVQFSSLNLSTYLSNLAI